MKYEIEKTCLCGCGEKFKTSRSDKKYVNRRHQVRGNNDRQYFVKQIQNKVHSITNKNFRIIKATLGRAITKTVSKEFLLISFLCTGYKDAFNNLSGPLKPALAFGLTF